MAPTEIVASSLSEKKAAPHAPWVRTTARIIVAAAVTQDANDTTPRVPMLQRGPAHGGAQPAQAAADAGSFSAAQVTDEALAEVDRYVAPDRQKHGAPPAPRPGPRRERGDRADAADAPDARRPGLLRAAQSGR